MIETLKQLCAAHGVSGDESDVASVIEKCAKPYADEITYDAMGNLYIFRKGRQEGRRIMTAAHMDEVGLIIKYVSPEGLLRFEPVGGMDPRVLIGRAVKIGSAGINGVIATKAIHLSDDEERKTAPGFDRLFIDIGADSEQEARKYVALGDTAVFDSEFADFGDGRIKCRSLDNRIGCACQLEALKNRPLFDTYFVFTVQEEIGLRGAYAAAYNIKPDLAIIVDTTTAADIPGVAEHEQGCKLGCGCALFILDNVTYYRKDTVDRAVSCAKANGIKYQIKNLVTGGVDAGAIQRSGEGVEVLTLATPSRYIHSAACVADTGDMQAAKELLCALLSDVGFLKG